MLYCKIGREGHSPQRHQSDSSFSVIGMHLNGDKITLNLMRGIKGKIGFGCYTFNTSSFSDDDVIIKVQ